VTNGAVVLTMSAAILDSAAVVDVDFTNDGKLVRDWDSQPLGNIGTAIAVTNGSTAT
jgi:hypothetical protein